VSPPPNLAAGQFCIRKFRRVTTDRRLCSIGLSVFLMYLSNKKEVFTGYDESQGAMPEFLQGYIFVADSMGLSSFKFSWWAPKDARARFETQRVMALQGHPRSYILISRNRDDKF